MAEKSWLYNSEGGDRVYNAEDIGAFLAPFFSGGIFANPSTNLQVTADDSGMTVTVQPGYALIKTLDGKLHMYRVDAPLTLPIGTADGTNSRVDRIVIRHETENRYAKAQVKAGTYAASSPVAPDVEQDADYWELALADISIPAGTTAIAQSAITDQRLNTAVCGIVAATVQQLDTSTLYAPIQDDLQHFRQDSESGFTSWSTAEKAAFEAWFQSIKNVLDSDTAGHLQNEIDAHTSDTTVHITAAERSAWNEKTNRYHFDVAVPASGWTGDTAPYTQTVSVAGLTAAMCPVMDLVQSDDVDTAQSQLDAYSYLDKAVTGDGTLTLTCYDFKPGVDLTVHLEVII